MADGLLPVKPARRASSAHQLHRALAVDYKSAWFLCHRIREAMRAGGLGPMGGGGKIVEADETYYGTLEKSVSHRADKGRRTSRANAPKLPPHRRSGRARRQPPLIPCPGCRQATVGKIVTENMLANPVAHRRKPPLSECGNGSHRMKRLNTRSRNMSRGDVHTNSIGRHSPSSSVE